MWSQLSHIVTIVTYGHNGRMHIHCAIQISISPPPPPPHSPPHLPDDIMTLRLLRRRR